MVAATPTRPARQWWRCPSCRATLGEVVDGWLVMLIRGEAVRILVVPGLRVSCRKCGAASVLN
jgi:hypothetical protein